ncbi:MAG: hypothetical protein K1X83_01895 [Oligoflexia bacterium]|nr:hypothetical protein [Oligoflexia bacterium]
MRWLKLLLARLEQAHFGRKISLVGVNMKMRSLASIAIGFCLFGCGGGGGEPAAPHYAGSWSGGVSLVSNSCPRAIPEEFRYISFLHNVEQGISEDALGNVLVDIVLNDGSDTFVGIGERDANGAGSKFSASGSPHELPGFLSHYTCIEILDFNYDAIDFVSLTAGFVTRHSTITCTRGSEIKTCDVTYTGSAYKTASP